MCVGQKPILVGAVVTLIASTVTGCGNSAECERLQGQVASAYGQMRSASDAAKDAWDRVIAGELDVEESRKANERRNEAAAKHTALVLELTEKCGQDAVTEMRLGL